MQSDRDRVMGLGRASGSAARLHDLATRQIVFTLPRASATLGLSEPTGGKATSNLEALGLVREMTGRARNRVFAYDAYLRLLQEDDPVPYP